jgi:hypothetical protein
MALPFGNLASKINPGIIYGLRIYAGYPSEMLEWHGHNDFYKAVVNSTAAWLYGASGVNCSLLGIGERTGNTPLEAMVFEYAQLRGTLDGMDTTVIRDIADYYEKELGYQIPARTPYIGSDFNMTQAGIHADGLLKDEEIYNIFDTTLLLKSPPGVAITATSGAAGIAMWLSTHVFSSEKLEKMIRASCAQGLGRRAVRRGRVTTISYQEMWQAVHMLKSCSNAQTGPSDRMIPKACFIASNARFGRMITPLSRQGKFPRPREAVQLAIRCSTRPIAPNTDTISLISTLPIFQGGNLARIGGKASSHHNASESSARNCASSSPSGYTRFERVTARYGSFASTLRPMASSASARGGVPAVAPRTGRKALALIISPIFSATTQG